jgi:hypothetical protein
MRQHRAVLMCATSSLLTALAGCGTDSMKSSSEPPPTAPITQAEEGKKQPPSGEVQERAVPGMVVPAVPVPGRVAPIPGPVVPAEAPVDMGLFAIRTSRETFLTAIGGGGRITDVFRTDMVRSQDWEQFRLWLFLKGRYSAIQTIGGNFVTAVGGGGQTTDALHTNATQIQAWEQFQFSRITNLSNFRGSLAISTIKGNFLTAVGGGGQTTNALRTVAGTIGDWEAFRLVKCGDLGSGQMWPWPYLSIYNLLPVTGGAVFTWGAQGGNPGYTSSSGGVLCDDPESFCPLKINPIRQADGSYVLSLVGGNRIGDSVYYQATSTGILYAQQGGGLVPIQISRGESPGGYSYQDVLGLTAVNLGDAYAKFRLLDQGDCTYVIQTFLGYYVRLYKPDPANHPKYTLFATDRNTISDATRFWLVVGGNEFQ